MRSNHQPPPVFRFIRQLRHRLITENRLSKYLLYAFGEVLLVVIGILIALQVDNWNQFRSDRKLEKKILRDLREELLRNKNKVNEALVRKEALYQPLANYIELIAENQVAYDDFFATHNKSFFSGYINPSFGVINSFISSGDVNLISNDSLKYLITDWKDYLERFLDVEHASFQGHRRFSEYFDPRFPAYGNDFHHKSSEDLRRRFDQIYNDVEYVNRLITIQEHFKNALDVGEQVVDHIDQMVQIIDWEIDKLE